MDVRSVLTCENFGNGFQIIPKFNRGTRETQIKIRFFRGERSMLAPCTLRLCTQLAQTAFFLVNTPVLLYTLIDEVCRKHVNELPCQLCGTLSRTLSHTKTPPCGKKQSHYPRSFFVHGCVLCGRGTITLSAFNSFQDAHRVAGGPGILDDVQAQPSVRIH